MTRQLRGAGRVGDVGVADPHWHLYQSSVSISAAHAGCTGRAGGGRPADRRGPVVVGDCASDLVLGSAWQLPVRA